MNKLISIPTTPTMLEVLQSNICDSVGNIRAHYNTRARDSIHLNGFEVLPAVHCDTSEREEHGALLMDLSNTAARNEGLNGITKKGNILECCTFTQTAFLVGLLRTFSNDQIIKLFDRSDKSFKFIIRALSAKAEHDGAHVIEDFMDLRQFEKDATDYQLHKSDIVFVEKRIIRLCQFSLLIQFRIKLFQLSAPSRLHA